MRRALLTAVALLAGCVTIQLGHPLGAPASDPPAFPLERAWERDVQAAFGPSAATITDRYVLVGTRRGEVVVLDRETGQPAGAAEVGMSVEGALAVSEDRTILYVPTADREGGVSAYDVRRGGTRWRWRGGAVQGGAVRVGGVVVAATLDGTVVGLDAESGEQRWGHESAVGVQVHAAPVASGADVLVADDRGRVVRYDAATGAERWVAEVGAPIYAAPTVADGAVYVSTTRGTLHRLDAATGREVWSISVDAAPRLTSAVVDGASVLVGGTDGSVSQLDAATGAERWRFTTDGVVAAPPFPFDGHVAVGTMDQRLVVLDGATGAEVWSTGVRGRVKSALAAGGGMLVVLTEPRHVVAFHTAP